MGRTVPEKSKRYGEKVCMAGFSPELRSLIRLYPIPIQFKIKSRSMHRVHVERNRRDSRIESWAVKDRQPHKAIWKVKDKIEERVIKDFLEKNIHKSIDWLNSRRMSLGIIKPNTFKPVIKKRKEFKDSSQLKLFDDFKSDKAFKTATDYFNIPYLYFTDTKSHTLQIREWGLYELLRKYTLKNRLLTQEDMIKSLYLDDNKDTFLIVGNMIHIPNVWLIIKIFSFKKKQKNLELF